VLKKVAIVTKFNTHGVGAGIKHSQLEVCFWRIGHRLGYTELCNLHEIEKLQLRWPRAVARTPAFSHALQRTRTTERGGSHSCDDPR
jgi:hypothetical protein